MNPIVEQIIRKIDKGKAFDSHFVIDTIIKEHSDDYLTFVAGHLASSKVTEYAHSEIAKIIASFRGILVEDLPYQSVSYNIRGKASSCALWKRI
jgi:hypothetical protein